MFEKVPVLVKGRENLKGINLEHKVFEKVPVLLKGRKNLYLSFVESLTAINLYGIPYTLSVAG